MINIKADSTVAVPVPAFVLKFIFWNTILHFLQLVFILTDMISSVEVIWAANRKDGHFLFRYNGNDK